MAHFAIEIVPKVGVGVHVKAMISEVIWQTFRLLRLTFGQLGYTLLLKNGFDKLNVETIIKALSKQICSL